MNPLHAHPAPTLHVWLRAMHESPHGLLSVHTLQHVLPPGPAVSQSSQPTSPTVIPIASTHLENHITRASHVGG